MKNYQFFCDFDGTITKEDTLNKFLRVYANVEWTDIEDKWLRGEIGSKQCIEQQMQTFPLMEEKNVNDFIDSIEIDETFPDFLNYIKSENIDFYIVSDGFDFFIEKIRIKVDPIKKLLTLILPVYLIVCWGNPINLSIKNEEWPSFI